MEQQRRTSKKREAIYAALCAAKDHPTAEMLLNRLKPFYPELSLGTVYRNLTLFKEDGMAIVPCTVDGVERFDGCVIPHPHFVCTSCRTVIDFESAEGFDTAVEALCASNSCTLSSYALTLYGICSCCRKQLPN